MKNTTTLFLMTEETPDATVTEFAEASAATGAHLGCLIIGAGPALPYSSYGVPPYGTLNVPDDWGEQLDIARKRQNARMHEVEQLLARSNVSGDVQSAFCVISEIRHHVGRKACVSDIAHIASNLRDAPEIWRETIHGVLFQSPIGLMLNATPGPHAKRIFIAWDSSKPAARAVHVALPTLKEAEEVVVACFDPVTTPDDAGADPGIGLATWLSHHGCTVTVSQFPTGGKEVARCIQDRARESGADLVVMGAYGHARMLQAVFGGTTRSMTEQTHLPVLLAH